MHIPKTAGISVEHVFLDLLDLTWDTRAPLLLRPNDEPDLGPPRLSHLAAHEYVQMKYMTQEQFDSYYKFTFVRNPWSRVLSFYKYMGFLGRCTFKTFVEKKLAEQLRNENAWFYRPQHEFFYDQDGQSLVEFIGRFESLQDDFNKVCDKLGLPPQELPHKNKSKRPSAAFRFRPKAVVKYGINLAQRAMSFLPEYKHYTEAFDDSTRDIVADIYQRDIELFGYKFGE